MNNIHNFNGNHLLLNTGSMLQCDNFTGNPSSVYEEISPTQQNGTPISNDSSSDKHNQSTLSSKKSDQSHLSSEDINELTVDSLEHTITEDRMTKIDEILLQLSTLSDPEKLLIQLRFPLSETDNYEEKNGDCNDFVNGGNQNEHNEALAWVMSHYEMDVRHSLKKQDVYEHYKSYCVSHNVKCLSTADFGKVMKKAFPKVKPRRLGPRGQSRYCYSGLANRNEIKSPMLTDVGLSCSKSGMSAESNHSDLDSNSSNYQQPDLSNIPEYELSSGILIDSALLIMDFLKTVGITKNVRSIKQAVEHLLLNNKVEMRSPHALRLLPFFQKMDNIKLKKEYLVDQVLNNIKKEESLSNPKSVPSFHSSPHATKRPQKSFMSPIANKAAAAYYEPSKLVQNIPMPVVQNYGQQLNNNTYAYGATNNVQQQFYNHNLMNIPQNIAHQLHSSTMSPNTGDSLSRKQFNPNTFSTPIKDSPSKGASPTLNSPLLDRNPTTTKRLELSNMSKSHHQSPSVSYSSMPHRTPTNDRSSHLTMYSSPLIFPNEHSQTKTSYLDRDVSSPVMMTARNYGHSSFDDDYNCDADAFDAFDTAPPIKRHIRCDYESLSPKLNQFCVDNNYGNLSSISSGYRQQSCEENEYLTTPGNSPTNRSTDQDPSENSSRNNTPQNVSGHLSLSMSEKAAQNAHLLDYLPKNILTFDLAYNNNNNNNGPYMHYTMGSVHGPNDEFSVSSTTNTTIIDGDGHPSSTIYK